MREWRVTTATGNPMEWVVLYQTTHHWFAVLCALAYSAWFDPLVVLVQYRDPPVAPPDQGAYRTVSEWKVL